MDIRDGDYVTISMPHTKRSQWYQVSHRYERNIWFTCGDDGMYGVDGSDEHTCLCSDVHEHVHRPLRSLDTAMMHNAPVVCRDTYGGKMFRDPSMWLYLPRAGKPRDCAGTLCPYIHRGWVSFRPTTTSRSARGFQALLWQVSVTTSSSPAEEFSFVMGYAPTSMLLEGDHVCMLAGVVVTTRWQINPRNGFARIRFESPHRAATYACGRVVNNTMLERNMAHIRALEKHETDKVLVEHHGRAVEQRANALLWSCEQAARVAHQASQSAHHHHREATAVICVAQCVRDIVDDVVHSCSSSYPKSNGVGVCACAGDTEGAAAAAGAAAATAAGAAAATAAGAAAATAAGAAAGEK
jgi:hypothetical protein